MTEKVEKNSVLGHTMDTPSGTFHSPNEKANANRKVLTSSKLFSVSQDNSSKFSTRYQQKFLSDPQAVFGSKIVKLQHSGSLYATKIEKERQILEEIEKEIQSIQESIHSKREDLLTNEQTDENHMKKKVKLLEAQYEKLKQDVSEALAKNKHSEQEISKIRLERVTINRLREKLEKELQEKAQEYIEVNKESENVWNEKKNAQNLLRDLQVQSQREEEFAEIEFQNQMIARDYKMNRSKSQEKNLAQSMSSFGTKSRLTQKNFHLDSQKKDQTSRATSASNESFRIKTKTFARKEPDEEKLAKLQQEVKDYREIFSRLEALTKQTTIEGTIRVLKDYEHENFGLFNYIGNVTSDIEKLDQEIGQIKEEKIKYTEDGFDDSKKENQLKLEQLAATTKELDENVDTLRKKQKKVSVLLTTIKKGMPDVLRQVGATSEEYKKEVIDLQDLTFSDLITALPLLEKRVGDIFQTLDACRSPRAGAEMKEIRTIKEEPKMSARVIKDEKKDKDEDEEGDISEKTDPYLHDVLSYINKEAEDSHPLTAQELRSFYEKMKDNIKDNNKENFKNSKKGWYKKENSSKKKEK